ncbi:Bcr/CflA family efflux MFS transporter [Solwaraspora sp. WMMD1047]|uniref:Bcr/CflA family efflux MFS transporter n=1 Tax=Solwaraspora sp. WMMD1047 TaxID=3016102 RepID=UPI002415EACF|nr:Bcr/CflA family efflux MFS transporter [Solwaraspora sp. WMMD1047]MDG4834359.1 Bcr/CflA family efflux MFS transporter [Solwaraspora sp. WMMD1047]
MSRWQLALLAGLTALGAASTDMYAPAFPTVQADLATSRMAIQSSVAVFLVAIAVGQVVVGLVSDVIGRRPVLLFGVLCYLAASLACAAATTVELLLLARAVQGAGAAAGIVVARASVQDRARDATATRPFSQLVVMTGLAPVLAPVVGAGLLHLGSWRWIFVVQAGLGALLAVAAVVSLPETLAPADRQPWRGRAVLAAQVRVLRVPQFRRYALAYGLAAGVVFGYASSYSFVVELQLGGSPLLYAVLFGLNGVGMIAFAQVNPGLVDRYGSVAVLVTGLVASTAASAALVAAIVWRLPLLVVAAATWVVIASRGTVLPNLTSRAMSAVSSGHGTASALLGSVQWAIGALAAVVAGITADAGVGMSLTMLVFSAAALLAATHRIPRRAGRPAAGTLPET